MARVNNHRRKHISDRIGMHKKADPDKFQNALAKEGKSVVK